MITKLEQKDADRLGLQRFHVIVNLAFVQRSEQTVMKNDFMYPPPMVKDAFKITELLKPRLTEENILTIIHSSKGSLGSVVLFEHGVKKA